MWVERVHLIELLFCTQTTVALGVCYVSPHAHLPTVRSRSNWISISSAFKSFMPTAGSFLVHWSCFNRLAFILAPRSARCLYQSSARVRPGAPSTFCTNNVRKSLIARRMVNC